jgi:hypothetical protein
VLTARISTRYGERPLPLPRAKAATVEPAAVAAALPDPGATGPYEVTRAV